MIDKLITTALNELDFREGSNESTKYGTWYGLPNQPWCAMFVSWCSNKSNIPTTIIPKYASCTAGVKWFYNNKTFKLKDKYTPKRGDIIFFTDNELNDKYYSSHTGIVEKVDSRVYVIEGNSPNGVYRRSYSLNDSYIKGYGVPNYVNEKYNIGDKVKFSKIYISSTSTKPLNPLVKFGTITKIYSGRNNPYLINSNTGFVNDNVITGKVDITYIVKKGDTLSDIAKQYNTTWQIIYENNKEVIGNNPNLILPGQKLII